MPDTLEAPPESPRAPAAAAKMGDMFRQRMSGAEKPGASALPPEKPAKGTKGTEATKGASALPTAAAQPTDKPADNSAVRTPPSAIVEEPKKFTGEQNVQRLNEAFDKARAEFNAQLAQRAKEREELAAELNNTKTELQKKEEFLERFYLEHDDRFKAKFDGVMEEAVSLGKRAAGRELAGKVESIFKMPAGEWRDQQFAELHASIESDLGKSRLMDAYNKLEETQSEREKALANSRENRVKLKQLDEQNSLLARAEQKRLREALYADVLANGEQAFPDLKLIEGNDEHNARVNEDRQRLKDFVTGDLTPKDMGNLALYAVKGMRAIQTDQAKDELIGKLQEQIKKLTAVQPGLTSASGEKTAGSEKEKPDVGRVLKRFHQAREQGVPEVV